MSRYTSQEEYRALPEVDVDGAPAASAAIRAGERERASLVWGSKGPDEGDTCG